MSAGDYEDVFASIANNAYQEIRAASAGERRMMFNLQTGGAWELYKRDSTGTGTRTLVASGSKAEIKDDLEILVAYDSYYELKNVSGGSVYQGYSYVVVK